MFPGHFKIAGHSGTEFKNRKAFKKIKKIHKNEVFQYGDQFGKQRNKIDRNRMALVEEKKNQRLLANAFFVFCLIVLTITGIGYLINQQMANLSPIIVEDKYDWKIHASGNTLKNIQTRQDSIFQDKKTKGN